MKKGEVKQTTKSKDSKKSSRKKVVTYIKGFDTLINGGLESNSTNLLVGGPGSGKTIFATSFAVGGMDHGEKCLYVTFEERKDEFYENMLKFGWDLAEYEKKGLFTFLQYNPIKVKTMLEEGGGSIEAIIVDKKINRVIIDSITSFALLFDDEGKKREAALSLFNMISGWNCTSLLTVEEESLKDKRNTANALGFESDSIIMIYFIPNDEGERERYIEIIKMRGTEHSRKVHRLNIGKDGISVDSKPSRIKFDI